MSSTPWIAGRCRVAVTWVPLMQGGGEPGIIQRWLQVAGQEPDAKRRADLGLAETFAELAGCRQVWKDALKEWNMRESVTIKEWQREAVVEDKCDTVLRLVRRKFATVPEEISSTVRSTTDLARLNDWIEGVALAATLEEFRQKTGL
jgi:hypothetical protein